MGEENEKTHSSEVYVKRPSDFRRLSIAPHNAEDKSDSESGNKAVLNTAIKQLIDAIEW